MKIILVAVLCFLAPGAAFGQNTPKIKFLNQECAQQFKSLRDSYRAAGQPNAPVPYLFGQLLDAYGQSGCFVSLILESNQAKHVGGNGVSDIAGLLANLQDKQSGASAGSSGTTNAISKNLTSSFLSIANEYGALTSSVSGQTTTLSGSLDQIPIAIEKNAKKLPECAVAITFSDCLPSGLVSFLGKVSYTASLNTSPSSGITGTASGSAQGGAQQVTGTQGGNSIGLSQFTAKFLAWHSKPTNSQLLAPSAAPTAVAAMQVLLCIEDGSANTSGCSAANRSSAWRTWFNAAAAALLAAPDDKVEAELKNRATLLVAALSSGTVTADNVIDAAKGYANAITVDASTARSAWDTIIWKSPIITVEYDYNTPSDQPTNSTFRLIYGQSLKSWKLTFNGAGSIYNSQPSSSIPNAGRLRDFQAGLEADRNLPKFGPLDASTFGLACYFQDQTSPAILNVTPGSPVSGVNFAGLSSNATQIFGQTGLIGLGQIKITLANSKGFSFPFAVSGSNQTELLTNTKPLFRAQIGISYDFDSLLGQ